MQIFRNHKFSLSRHSSIELSNFIQQFLLFPKSIPADFWCYVMLPKKYSSIMFSVSSLTLPFNGQRRSKERTEKDSQKSWTWKRAWKQLRNSVECFMCITKIFVKFRSLLYSPSIMLSFHEFYDWIFMRHRKRARRAMNLFSFYFCRQEFFTLF
jgi:hypothetical protein